MTKDCLIFRFDDGRGQFLARDPFKVDRLLARHLLGESVYRVWENARGPLDPDTGKPFNLFNPVCDEAMERLIAASYAAFDLMPVQQDGTGYNESTPIRVLGEFLRWKAEVKKNTESPPTFSAPMGPASSASPTKKSTDCGCSEAASAASAPSASLKP